MPIRLVSSVVASLVLASAASTATVTPLPAGYLRHLLHLGSHQSDLITGTQPGGPDIALDDFAYAGYDAEYWHQPSPGQAIDLGVATSETPLVWTDTLATRSDGVWDDGYGGDHYRQYYAIYIYAPTDHDLRIGYWIDDRVRVWMDRMPVLVVDANGSGSSVLFTVFAGWHCFLFKYEQIASSSVFALKFTDTLGADVTDLQYTLTDVITSLPIFAPGGGGGATDVDLGHDIAVVFDEPMDTASLPTASIPAVPGVAGHWSWQNDHFLKYIRSGPLTPGTTYTVTFPAGCADLAGNLVPPYTYSIATTGTAPAPASPLRPSESKSCGGGGGFGVIVALGALALARRRARG